MFGKYVMRVTLQQIKESRNLKCHLLIFLFLTGIYLSDKEKKTLKGKQRNLSLGVSIGLQVM